MLDFEQLWDEHHEMIDFSATGVDQWDRVNVVTKEEFKVCIEKIDAKLHPIDVESLLDHLNELSGNIEAGDYDEAQSNIANMENELRILVSSTVVVAGESFTPIKKSTLRIDDNQAEETS